MGSTCCSCSAGNHNGGTDVVVAAASPTLMLHSNGGALLSVKHNEIASGSHRSSAVSNNSTNNISSATGTSSCGVEDGSVVQGPSLAVAIDAAAAAHAVNPLLHHTHNNSTSFGGGNRSDDHLLLRSGLLDTSVSTSAHSVADPGLVMSQYLSTTGSHSAIGGPHASASVDVSASFLHELRRRSATAMSSSSSGSCNGVADSSREPSSGGQPLETMFI